MSSALTTRLLAALGPGVADRAGDLLEPFVDALTGPLAALDDLLAYSGRRWPAVFDLDANPEPRFLGQLAGTRVPVGLSPEEERIFIRDRASWRRGTPAALIAAVKPLLGGSQLVELVERTTSPWQFTLRVYADQLLPGVTADQVVAAAATQKPVGLVMTVDVSAGATYAHMTTAHGSTLADWAAQFPTYAAARSHLPE